MFGGLTANQRHPCLSAAISDTAHDICHDFWLDFAGRDVVSEEQRLGTTHNNVISNHRDKVNPDGVMNPHLLRDNNLRANAISSRGEQWPPKILEYRRIK